MQIEPSKKITLATVKAFIAKNRGELHISCRSRFNGMTDGVESCNDQGFTPVAAPSTEGKAFKNLGRDNTLGIAGAWFVFGSRDSFSAYDDGKFSGIKVYNCCGSFVLAVAKPDQCARKVAA